MASIGDLFAEVRAGIDLLPGDPRWLSHIRYVHAAYCALRRPAQDMDELVALKLTLCGWRVALCQRVLDAVSSGMQADADILVDGLSELRLRLSNPALQVLGQAIQDADLRLRLYTEQGRLPEGREDHPAAGPQQPLPILPNQITRWTFERWSKMAAFADYNVQEDGVHYRGNVFQPGDVLVTNINREGNGLYTGLSAPRNYASHTGCFAMISGNHPQQRFPVVMETFARGVRPVPLSIFLGPDFSSYCEIYRHEQVGVQHWSPINDEAQRQMAEVHGYNFNTEDPDERYLSCTRVGQQMLLAADIPGVRVRSQLAHPVRENLKHLGYHDEYYFAPVDYICQSGFQCVGLLDNHDYVKMVCRDRIDQQLRSLFMQKKVDERGFPLRYHFNLWGIKQIRAQTLLGRLISAVEGFDDISLPKGPDPMIALIQLAEKALAKNTKKVFTACSERLLQEAGCDVRELMNHAEVDALIERNIQLKWLV